MNLRIGFTAFVPAAIAAAAFTAAPAWSAATDTSTHSPTSAASKNAEEGSGMAAEPAARKHTRRKVAVDCVSEDPRKEKGHAPCAKVHPNDIPKVKTSAGSAHAAGTGQ